MGDEVVRSTLDGRSWTVVEIERKGDRIAIHPRKKGDRSPDRYFVRHRITVPPARALT